MNNTVYNKILWNIFSHNLIVSVEVGCSSTNYQLSIIVSTILVFSFFTIYPLFLANYFKLVPITLS